MKQDTNGMVQFGICSEQGLGVEADVAAAVFWYDSAVQAGSISGCLQLARCYDHGIGVQRDPKKAHALRLRAEKLRG